MKAYIKIISILIIVIGLFCFYLAYQKFQLPYDDNGVYVNSNGDIIKRVSAIKMLVFGVLSFAFVGIWNVLYKKIALKKD